MKFHSSALQLKLLLSKNLIAGVYKTESSLPFPSVVVVTHLQGNQTPHSSLRSHYSLLNIWLTFPNSLIR